MVFKKQLDRELTRFADHPKFEEIRFYLQQIRKKSNLKLAKRCIEKIENSNRSYLAPHFSKSIHGYVNHHSDISERILNMMFEEEILQTYDVYKPNHLQVFNVMNNLIFNFKNIDHGKDISVVYGDYCKDAAKVFAEYSKDIAKVFRIYRDVNNEPLFNFFRPLNSKNWAHLDVTELLSEAGYAEVKANGFYRMIKGYYSSIREVAAEEIDKKLSYEDMSTSSQALSLIFQINESKYILYQKQIVGGFFKEMRRALKQGRNDKERIQYLKIYGKEVLDKIRENVNELMVITNA